MPFWRHEDIDEKALVTNAGDAGNESDGDLEAGTPREKEPSDRLTAHQIFYIFGPHGIGAAVLSGGINFAIAYGEFHFGSLRDYGSRALKRQRPQKRP